MSTQISVARCRNEVRFGRRFSSPDGGVLAALQPAPHHPPFSPGENGGGSGLTLSTSCASRFVGFAKPAFFVWSFLAFCFFRTLLESAACTRAAPKHFGPPFPNSAWAFKPEPDAPWRKNGRKFSGWVDYWGVESAMATRMIQYAMLPVWKSVLSAWMLWINGVSKVSSGGSAKPSSNPQMHGGIPTT